MDDINKTIKKILDAPTKTVTADEARKTLRDCGVFDENNELKDIYKGIVIKINE